MGVFEDTHLAGLIIFPILAVTVFVFYAIRNSRGEELFRTLMHHPHALLNPLSLFRSDSMRAASMVHVPAFLNTWKRYRGLYMGVVAYLVIMTFYYAELYEVETFVLRPTGQLVDAGRWLAYTVVGYIAMRVLTLLLYVHKEQAIFVHLFGTLSPIALFLSTRVVSQMGVIILTASAGVFTAIAFIYVLPANFIGRYRYRNRWRHFGNKYLWFGLSILAIYGLVGLGFLLDSSNLLTSVFSINDASIYNVVIDVVVAVYVVLMVSLKFFTSKLNVYTEVLTEEHYKVNTDPSVYAGDDNDDNEKVPISPLVIEPTPNPTIVPSAPTFRQTPSFKFGRPTKSTQYV